MTVGDGANDAEQILDMNGKEKKKINYVESSLDQES
jgi:hypothetical protein